MRQNQHFTLAEIAGIPYLLPIGQAIADQKRGLKTNATGAWLWNLFKEEHSPEEAIAHCASHYGISEKDYPSFHAEITQFLEQLLHFGILLDAPEDPVESASVLQEIIASRISASSKVTAGPKETDSVSTSNHLLSIGNLIINLTCTETAFPSEFSDFLLAFPQQAVPEIQQTIHLHPYLPEEDILGNVLLHNPELNIVESETAYLLHFPAAHQPLEIHLSKDGRSVHCYSIPPYDADFRYDFFHAIRLVYLYLAQKFSMVALHSASLLYQDKLWLFSGPSGAGKSTHTNLWNEVLGTPVINGDLNLLAMENGNPVVHGIPWCGTSGIYDTKTYPLGGIILLNQAKENHVEHLSPDQKRLLFSQRLISPAWTETLWNEIFRPVDEIADQILICRLHCTKDKDAVDTIKKEIDSFLE